MKSFLKVMLPICTSSLISTSAFAMPADFVGTWQNINPNTRGIVKVVIAPDMSMHMWGACTPTPCDNGTAPLTTFGTTVTDTNHRAATAHYKFSFKDVGTVVKLPSMHMLMLEHFNKFTDGSERQNYYMQERLRKVLVPVLE
jgi:hypothetical protein